MKNPPPLPFDEVQATPDGREFVLRTYYPQMGGYAGECVVTFDRETNSGPDPEPGCFSVDVWHDGEFPFTGEKRGRFEGDCLACGEPVVEEQVSPSHLHHCSAEQFINFGLRVLEAQTAHQKVPIDRKWRDAVVARLLALPVR